MYEVSNKGKVRNKQTLLILKTYTINSGYKAIKLNKNGKSKGFTIHRLVATAFIDNPLKLKTVNHKDGNKLNNRVDNLEWMSLSDNIKHAVDTGLSNTEKAREVLNEVASKRIYQKDKEGNIIAEWDSATQASKDSNGYYSVNHISSVLHGRREHHRGYTWEFIDRDKIKRSKSYKISIYKEGSLIAKEVSMRRAMSIIGVGNYRKFKKEVDESNGNLITINGYTVIGYR